MNSGRVKFWNTKKGYGFIHTPESGDDGIFAHISNVVDEEIDELPPGARVSFEIGPCKRRPDSVEAKEIRIIA
jgi:CspA family cold shock protein